MPYIGNTIRAADDYRLIDDISSSFNGSTTSFALQVAGSAPVPFPKSPQQVLISVNGVIQEPDPTGASGFNLVGTNIVFSSAPTNGHAFFGIIYATADYLNSGGNFPTGSLGAPSITFVGDEDTGIYRKGSGSIGFVSNSTEIANTDSNGITISSGNLILGDSSGASDDRIKLGASGDLEIFHNGTDSRITNSTGDLSIRGNSLKLASTTGEEYFRATANGSVDLFHDNVVKLTTNSDGYRSNDNVKAQFGNNSDLNIYHNGTHSFVQDSGTGNLMLAASAFQVTNAAVSETMIYAASDGAVELYHDNSKKFETTSGGATLTGSLTVDEIQLGDGEMIRFGSDSDCLIEHTGTVLEIDNNTGGINMDSTDTIQLRVGSNETAAKFIPNGAVELYWNNAKKMETYEFGVNFTQNIKTELHVNLLDNGEVILGTGQDFKIFHNGTNNVFQGIAGHTIFEVPVGKRFSLQKAGGQEDMFNAYPDGKVELRYDSAVRLETTTGGISVTGGVTCDGVTLGDNEIIQLGNSSDMRIYHDSGANYVGSFTAQSLVFFTNNASRWFIDATGHFLPITDNTFDLGSASKRVRNLYTTDLKLSNEGSQNDVDSTWGNYTIQEGHEDLFLINHRTGKKFKFNLTEVS